MKRGDIYWCIGYKNLGKVRPWLIVQNSDSMPEWPSVTACPLTTDDSELARGVRLMVKADGINRLEVPSIVMIDKVSTLPVERIKNRHGRLAAADLKKVDILLARWIGL